MSNTNNIIIENTIEKCLRNKLNNYHPEPAHMPFHTSLLGKDRMALYSFIHSLATNFGEAIFEPVALELARNNFEIAKSHQVSGSFCSEMAEMEISRIMNGLITANSIPNKKEEFIRIKEVCRKGNTVKVKPTKIDVLLINKGVYYLFDIKTAKPNRGGFKEFKRTLLQWVAVMLYDNPEIEVNSLIAIPYNPYEPKPYSRWTMRGMLDLDSELKVGKEFWDFLGGEGSYEILLTCFENVGIKMRKEIDTYFLRFNR